MTHHKSPRLLVADDDLGVIAAYRLVLESSRNAAGTQDLMGLNTLENELFGTVSSHGDTLPWRVHFVDQGEDAVAAVKDATAQGDPFAGVFLDVRMPPGIDGYETAQQIRQFDPAVHIVFVSGYSDYDSDDLIEACGTGTNLTILPKPVWPDQLRAVAAQIATLKS